MDSIAKKIVELRIATRRACMCEKGNKALLSLKTKILYVMSERMKTVPIDLITELNINKSNLAIITKQMEGQGLIQKAQDQLDKREIYYTITASGTEYLSERLAAIEKTFNGVFSRREEEAEFLSSIDGVLHILSFLTIE